MDQRRKRFKDQAGNELEGVVVDVDEATERFSDILLKDGTRLKIRPVVTEAIRLDDQWDNERNPVYVVRAANVVTINEVNEDLKKKGE